jgi:subtilisin family serine protease
MRTTSLVAFGATLMILACSPSANLADGWSDESGEGSNVGVSQSALTQPNAPWHLDRIDQATLPLNTTYNYNCTGSGVTVYIVGTRIYAGHGEFAGRASNFPGGLILNCQNDGTEVAGTVGSATYGVAKQAQLVGVGPCATGAGGMTFSELNDTLEYVYDQAISGHLPAVAVLGAPMGPPPAYIKLSLERLIDAGVSVVIPIVPDGMSYGLHPAIMNVAATNSSDNLLWSPYSGPVDLRAPGSSVRTTSRNGSFVTVGGTHVAAGIVAGAAAQYLSLNPTASPPAVKAALQAGGATILASTAKLVQTPCP